jgi:hypothetical protein
MVGIVFLLTAKVASAQDSPEWNKPALRDSVISLLSKYQHLHNQLNVQNDSLVREFIHLFSNPWVNVVNDLIGQTKPSKISIEDYVVQVGELYPDGLMINLDFGRLTVDQPKYDRNDRYLIRIRVNRSLNGISGGKVFSSSQRIAVLIAFKYLNNAPGSFSIYGMDLPPKGQSFITAAVTPSLTGFANSTLGTDTRLFQKNGIVYNGGIQFTHYFSDHWGISSGAWYSSYSGDIGLGKFDSYNGFDPNIRDVVIENDLWFVEIPVLLSWRTNPLKRLELHADLGISTGIRCFESAASTAVNANTGAVMVNVFSDADWIAGMNRLVLGLQGSISLKYRFTDRLGLLIGGGMHQGLLGLDNISHSDFINTKYLGQFNPLWGAPGKTVTKAFFINLGVAVLLNKEKN